MLAPSLCLFESRLSISSHGYKIAKIVVKNHRTIEKIGKGQEKIGFTAMMLRGLVIFVWLTWMARCCESLSLPPILEGLSQGDASAVAAGAGATSCGHVTSLMTSLKLALPPPAAAGKFVSISCLDLDGFFFFCLNFRKWENQSRDS